MTKYIWYFRKLTSLILLTFFFISPQKTLAQINPMPVKVAFIGDSGAASDFQKVLNLIKQEGAQMVLHQGDFAYDDGQSNWENMINATLGANFPYLGSNGNHDSWSSYAPFFKDRLSTMGMNENAISTSNASYSVIYKDLKLVFSKENGDAGFIQSQLTGDNHTWKICSWHKNMNAMQVGGKSDEQGWGDYEECRKAGAIIATAHEHSYHRTKTLTSTQNQTVDQTCANPNSVCVSPGRTFVFVSGLGGRSIRNQDRCLPTGPPYGCKGEWANIYTSDQNAQYGALFITFNYQNDPVKAHAYFKNISNQTIDEFDIKAGLGNGGVTVTPYGDTITPGKPGDADGNGLVDGLDYVIWLNNYNQQTTGAGRGDFNNSGYVDGLDYVIWLNNYGI